MTFEVFSSLPWKPREYAFDIREKVRIKLCEQDMFVVLSIVDLLLRFNKGSYFFTSFTFEDGCWAVLDTPSTYTIVATIKHTHTHTHTYIYMFVKLTLEIWAIRRQQHLFSIHKGMLIWTCRSFGESLLLSELTHHLFVPDCGRAVNRRYFWESHLCICRLWIDNCCQGCCTNNNLQDHAICRSTSRQNGRHFADDLFKCVFLNENVWIAI